MTNQHISTDNEEDDDDYEEKGIDYKYEGSVMIDSNDDHPEAEYLDKVEIEPLQQTTLGSPISVMKLDKLTNVQTPEKFE